MDATVEAESRLQSCTAMMNINSVTVKDVTNDIEKDIILAVEKDKSFDAEKDATFEHGSNKESNAGEGINNDEGKNNVETWRCGYCQASFDLQSVLNDHFGMRKVKGSHTCPVCRKGFRCAQLFHDHYSQHGLKDMACFICGEILRRGEKYKKHVREHAEVNDLSCEQCGKDFSLESDLLNHTCVASDKKVTKHKSKRKMVLTRNTFHEKNNKSQGNKRVRITHNELGQNKGQAYHGMSGINTTSSSNSEEEKATSSDLCQNSQEFSSPTRKSARLKGKTNFVLSLLNLSPAMKKLESVKDKPKETTILKDTDIQSNETSTSEISKPDSVADENHKCKDCDAVFTAATSLKRHSNTHLQTANPTETHKCLKCDKTFKQKRYLVDHQRVHSKKLQHCEICGLEMKYSPSNLNRHMKKHLNKRDFKCTLCNKAFYRNDDLQVHIRSHTKNKLYQCDVCKVAYFSLGNLTRHLKYHDHDALHCPVCDQAFVGTKSLHDHIEQNHIEKANLPCNFCQKRFCSRYRRDKHCQEEHGQEMANVVKAKDVEGRVFDVNKETEKKKGVEEEKLRLTVQCERNELKEGKEITIDEINMEQGIERTIQNSHPSISNREQEMCKNVINIDHNVDRVLNNVGQRTESLPINNRVEISSTCEGQDINGKSKEQEIGGFTKNKECDVNSPVMTEEMEQVNDSITTGESMSLIETEELDEEEEEKLIRDMFSSLQCDTCGKLFSSSSNLGRHKHIHKKNTEAFACTECEKSFTCERYLRDHTMKVHQNSMSKICPICNEVIKHNMARHLKIHSIEGVFKCLQCEQSFKLKDDLKNHCKLKHADTGYRCGTCSKAFSSLSNLIRHKHLHNLGKDNLDFICHVCGRGFACNNYLKTHIIRNHSKGYEGSKPSVCPHCGIIIGSQSNFKRHMQIHTENKPYTCQTCGKQFRRTDDLNVHMKSHLDDKPYMCDECGKGFKQRQNLTKHVRRHKEGKGMFFCDHCGKLFRQRKAFARHGENCSTQPLSCSICDEKLKNRRALMRHMKRHPPYMKEMAGKNSMDFLLPDSAIQTQSEGVVLQTTPGKVIHVQPSSEIQEATLSISTEVDDGNSFDADSSAKEILIVMQTQNSSIYKCSLCSHAFLNTDDLVNHMVQHSQLQEYL